MLSDENSMLHSLGNFCHFFSMQNTLHFRGYIRQDHPPIFSSKAQRRHPHKHGNPHSISDTTTHMESYHEDSILLTVIKALHYLANIYSALTMRERKNETYMDLALKAITFFCMIQKLVPCEILIKIPNPYICVMVYFAASSSKYHVK